MFLPSPLFWILLKQQVRWEYFVLFWHSSVSFLLLYSRRTHEIWLTGCGYHVIIHEAYLLTADVDEWARKPCRRIHTSLLDSRLMNEIAGKLDCNPLSETFLGPYFPDSCLVPCWLTSACQVPRAEEIQCRLPLIPTTVNEAVIVHPRWACYLPSDILPAIIQTNLFLFCNKDHSLSILQCPSA